MAVDIVLFDLGRVLLDWEPDRLYRKIIADDAERAWFLANVCTMAWHTEHDRGVSFADNAARLTAEFPDYEAEIRAWGERWMEMFDGYVVGTPDLLRALLARDVPVYALSNMPLETWPLMQTHFPLVNEFRHAVISGEIHLVKPDAAIFHHTLEKMGQPDPETVLFIDDSLPNVEAATALGIQTLHFQGAEGLAARLRAEGLL